MLNLQGFCRVFKAFPLDEDGRVAVLQSELLNTNSEVYLITVELPHSLSGALLCLVLIYGHHLWLCFSATILAFLFPLLLC